MHREDPTQEAYCALKMAQAGALSSDELRKIYLDLFPHHKRAVFAHMEDKA